MKPWKHVLNQTLYLLTWRLELMQVGSMLSCVFPKIITLVICTMQQETWFIGPYDSNASVPERSVMFLLVNCRHQRCWNSLAMRLRYAVIWCTVALLLSATCIATLRSTRAFTNYWRKKIACSDSGFQQTVNFLNILTTFNECICFAVSKSRCFVCPSKTNHIYCRVKQAASFSYRSGPQVTSAS